MEPIKPCPNPECRASDAPSCVVGVGRKWHVECSCGVSGPHCTSSAKGTDYDSPADLTAQQSATDGWNSFPRMAQTIPDRPATVDAEEWKARMACIDILNVPDHLDWVVFEVARGKMMDAVHAARRIRDGDPDQEQYSAWILGLTRGAMVQIEVVPNKYADRQLLPDLYQVERLTPKQLSVTGWWAKFRRVTPTRNRRGVYHGVGIGWCVMTEPGGGRARLKMPPAWMLEAEKETSE